MAELPPFPGAVGASHLRVYDTQAPDGLAGGTPHLHTVCTEAYWVVAGRGAVQTLTTSGYEETPLEPGALVWFTPGTIHRLINRDALEILVLMQNAGLPEAGDMVVTLAPEVVADPDRYAAAAVLPADEQTDAGTGAAARARRDAAVVEFGRLRDAVVAGDGAPLAQFHASANALVAPKLAAWERRWHAGPLAAALRTGQQLEALARGDHTHLRDAAVHRMAPPSGPRRMGCCGTLGTYVLPA